MKNKNLANFLFEAAALIRLQRTGWQILGGGNKESVADHSYMVSVISFVLARQTKADIGKVLVMSLFHDFTESRMGDIYKLADLYVTADVTKAAGDAFSALPDEKELISVTREYEQRKTLEAKIVHDADTIALCIELKQLIEHGNLHAREWFEANVEGLTLKEAKELVMQIKKSDSQDWWKKEREKIHKSFLK